MPKRMIDMSKKLSWYIHLLLNYGVKETDIGVIAPYRAQVSNLRKLLPNSITVDTVDGFQGQERQVIVMSLVRTNALGKVGFLNEKRRLNVAVTRARRQFVLVGNSTTMKMADSEYLYSLLEYITIYGTTIAPSDVIEFDKNIKISSH
ncbi:unnamed protein product [Dracunculus medinensis]|uniref:AAA_12 domain-containing protein n=1 Tax=Dracunculus medinensis TaxID=318479 RepID=A0A0N4U9K4_DRAME|nr:unnamed protein product [Dracunculus medinensis]